MDALIHSRNPSIAQLRRPREFGRLEVGSAALPVAVSGVAGGGGAGPTTFWWSIRMIVCCPRIWRPTARCANRSSALPGAPSSSTASFSIVRDSLAMHTRPLRRRSSRENTRRALPDVVVAGGEYALRFLLQNRAALFPNAPIVFIGLSPAEIQALAPLPKDVIGVPVEFDYAGTIEQALRFHPKATRLIVITGANRFDRRDEAELAGVPRAPQWPRQRRVACRSADRRDRTSACARSDRRMSSLRRASSPMAPGASSARANRRRSLPKRRTRRSMGRSIRSSVPASSAASCRAMRAMGKDAAALVNRLLEGVPANSIDVPAQHAVGAADRLAAGASLGHQRRTAAARRDRSLQRADVLGGVWPCGADRARRDAAADRSDRCAAVRKAPAAAYRRGARSERTADGVGRAHRAPQQLGVERRAATADEWRGDGVASVPHAPLSKEPAAIDFDQVLEITHPADREALSRAVRKRWPTTRN